LPDKLSQTFSNFNYIYLYYYRLSRVAVILEFKKMGDSLLLKR